LVLLLGAKSVKSSVVFEPKDADEEHHDECRANGEVTVELKKHVPQSQER
jgi:hypothetical protein